MTINITSKLLLREADQAHSHKGMLHDTRFHTQIISIINNRRPTVQRAWQQDNFGMSIVQRLILLGFKQQYHSSTMTIRGRMRQGAKQLADTRISSGERSTRHTSMLALQGTTSLLVDVGSTMHQRGIRGIKPRRAIQHGNGSNIWPVVYQDSGSLSTFAWRCASVYYVNIAFEDLPNYASVYGILAHVVTTPYCRNPVAWYIQSV